MPPPLLLAEQPQIQAITKYLETQPTVLAALVFGSAASGRLRPDSDLDVALLFAHEHVPDPFAAFELGSSLKRDAQRDVDLIVLNGASPIIAFQAVKYGRLISY